VVVGTLWKSRTYRPEQVTARYVRYEGGEHYRFCEVGADQRFDVRQGTCRVDDVPPDVAIKAIGLYNEGVTPSYVEWPLDKEA